MFAHSAGGAGAALVKRAVNTSRFGVLVKRFSSEWPRIFRSGLNSRRSERTTGGAGSCPAASPGGFPVGLVADAVAPSSHHGVVGTPKSRGSGGIAASVALATALFVGASSVALAESTAACGEPGLAPCPLQGWMRSNLGAQLARRDFEGLATGLERLAAAPPGEGFESWSELAREGAQAARSKELARVRSACRACHEEHRARYRKEKRRSPAPP